MTSLSSENKKARCETGLFAFCGVNSAYRRLLPMKRSMNRNRLMKLI